MHQPEPQDFDQLLSAVNLPQKSRIWTHTRNNISGEIESKEETSLGSFPSREAFETSEIVETCRTIYNLDNRSAIAALPGFFELLSSKKEIELSKIGHSEWDRQQAQSHFDDDVMKKVLFALVKRLGNDAVEILIETLRSPSTLVRITTLDALEKVKIFPPEVLRGAINRWGAILIDLAEQEDERKALMDELLSKGETIENFNEFNPPDSKTLERLKFLWQRFTGETKDEDPHLLTEQRQVASYLMASEAALDPYFDRLLSFTKALEFNVDAIDQRVIDHSNILKEIIKRNPQKTQVSIKRSLFNENPKLRAFALEIIQSLPRMFLDTIEQVELMLDDTEDSIRYDALRTLGAFETSAANSGPAVFAIATSKTDPRSNLAINILGSIKEPREKIVPFLINEWEEIKELEQETEFLMGKEGEREDKISGYALAHASLNIPSEYDSEGYEDPRKRIHPILSSLGSFLSSETRVQEIYFDAMEIPSYLVREAITSGLIRSKDFNAARPFLLRALETQPRSDKLVDIAFQFGKSGETLINEYRKDVLRKSREESNTDQRYKEHLKKLDSAIGRSGAIAKYHRTNNTGYYFIKTNK